MMMMMMMLDVLSNNTRDVKCSISRVRSHVKKSFFRHHAKNDPSRPHHQNDNQHSDSPQHPQQGPNELIEVS
jgi:hypothetical protein